MSQRNLDNAGSLAMLGLATALWAFSFGVEAPISSLWLKDTNHSTTLIGLNTGVYYVALALAAGLVPSLMRRWGRICIVIGMIGTGATVAVFPWAGSVWGYFLIRGLNGIFGAICLIPLETLISEQSSSTRRARAFGFYACAVGFGMALGTLGGLFIYGVSAHLAFLAGGLAAASAGTVFAVWLPTLPAVERLTRIEGGLTDFAAHSLSYGSSWVQGFLESSFLGLLPVYFRSVGYVEATYSQMISGAIVAAIVAQIPIAWLADRAGRAPVLTGCHIMAALAMIFLPFCSGWAELTVGLMLVTACVGAYYPLGLTILSERVSSQGLAGANARFMSINCVGSMLGPVITGAAMDHFGGKSLFGIALAATLVVLGLCLVSRFLAPRKVVLPDGIQMDSKPKAA